MLNEDKHQRETEKLLGSARTIPCQLMHSRRTSGEATYTVPFKLLIGYSAGNNCNVQNKSNFRHIVSDIAVWWVESTACSRNQKAQVEAEVHAQIVAVWALAYHVRLVGCEKGLRAN